MEKEICLNCKHAKSTIDLYYGQTFLQCRCMPPSVIVNFNLHPEQTTTNANGERVSHIDIFKTKSLWPKVNEFDFCSQFSQKEI